MQRETSPSTGAFRVPLAGDGTETLPAEFHNSLAASVPVIAETYSHNREACRASVPQVLEFKDNCYNVQSAVAAFTTSEGIFHDLLEDAGPQSLKDGWYEIFHDPIERILPEITEFRDWLEDTDSEGHKNASNAAETVLEKFKTSETVGDGPGITEVRAFVSENSEIPL
ncbi:hypothetical protein B0H11DRAFT_1921392 [Mycena galericulata]|nr:hypothetical protein B0H11DRAFT_1921392 [Mycena galericulata]